MLIAIDPAAFGGEGALAHFGALAKSIEDQPGARLPGARRLAARDKAAKEGLTITDKLLADIEAV